MVSQDKIQAVFPSFEPALTETLAAAAQMKEIKAGGVLMKTGQNIRSTILIISGLVKIVREDEEGNEFFMYYLHPGEACALSMICAIKQETSEIMAKAIIDTEVLAIPLTYMDQWATQYKSWYNFVVSTYRSRFEDILHTIDNVAFRNLDERLIFYLRRQQQSFGSSSIPLSFTEIAQDLNSSREVISRLMKKLSEKGLVNLHRNYIEIVDLNRLLT